MFCLVVANFHIISFQLESSTDYLTYIYRAAAYTQVSQYTEAIRDCLKSIEIDPAYGKAYSRLGFAYYARGNYRDAIDKGFMKGRCHITFYEPEWLPNQCMNIIFIGLSILICVYIYFILIKVTHNIF